MTALTFFTGGLGRQVRGPGLGRFLAASVVLHVAILAVAGTATLYRRHLPPYRPAYTVDLVSLAPSPRPAAPAPGAPSAAPAQGGKPGLTPAAKPSVKPPPSRAATAPGKVEEPVKSKAALPVRAGEGDEAARKRTDRLKKIAELEQEAQKLYESIQTVNSPHGPAAASGQGAAGPKAGAGDAHAGAEGPTRAVGPLSTGAGTVDLRMKAYYDRIWEEIKASWILPADVSPTDRQLVTVLGIRIAPSGSIEHHWVEKPSGNIYYDQSAIRAINKANPLPPPPRELAGGSLEVGINFRVTE